MQPLQYHAAAIVLVGSIIAIGAFGPVRGQAVRYPSDAASGLDWNGFAVYGVKRVREARDVRQLETTLRDLFRPLGPGIEIGKGLPPAPAQG